MRYHPATLMLLVWTGAVLLLIILPFELTHRTIEPGGIAVLGLFLGAFCLGAFIKSLPLRQRFPSQTAVLRFNSTDRVLKMVAGIAAVSLTLEVTRGNGMDLIGAYLERSERAQALLHGGLSQSTLLFKIGFLSYPASYVYLARQIIFNKKMELANILIFGVAPGFLAALAMGGRTQMFNVIIYLVISYGVRKRASKLNIVTNKRTPLYARAAAVVVAVLSINYFINVFIARSDSYGGPELMLDFAGNEWGITFAGPNTDLMIEVLGSTTTYLVFVFSWYLIQGIVISNSLFVSYNAGPLWGAYGVDIFSAILRRINGESIAAKFAYLLDLETYGFFPSAFGTLFVDYSYGGVIIAAIWGWLAALVYRHVRQGHDARWLLLVPFVIFGILFSIVNTPIGYSNGFVMYFWLIVAFLLIRTSD